MLEHFQSFVACLWTVSCRVSSGELLSCVAGHVICEVAGRLQVDEIATRLHLNIDGGCITTWVRRYQASAL